MTHIGEGGASPAIQLDLQYGSRLVTEGDVGSSVYLPVSPADIDPQSGGSWTVNRLAKLAFDTIPPEFPEERQAAEKCLQLIEARTKEGEKITLPVVGPDEGDYHIVLKREND